MQGVSQRDAAKQLTRVSIPGEVETALQGSSLRHAGYWLSSLRLRSELAQLVIRLHSWILDSSEAELCSWFVAHRSLIRTASSASCNID